MPYSPGIATTWGQENWSPVLIEALTLQSAVLRAGASRVVTDGRVVHIPRLKVNPAASWVAELEEIPSDSGDADTLALVPRKVANVLNLSTESVEDAPVNELDAVGAAMVRGVATKLDAAFFSSNAETATVPAGILSDTLPGETGAVTIDSILDGIGAIEAAGGLPDTVFMAPADITLLRKSKASGTGQYLLAPDAASVQGPGAERVGGATLIPTSGLSAGTAVVCQASFIQLAIRRDAAVEFSAEAKFTADAIVARITMRVDWGIGDPAAFYAIKATVGTEAPRAASRRSR